MIRMLNIAKRYQMGDQSVTALDGVTLRVKRGEFVAIIGPSGSGKSTLMNITGCLDAADEGEYYLDGEAVDTLSERKLARIRNEKIGFIFQGFNLLNRLTALENVELPLIYRGIPSGQRRKRALEALEQVGLTARMKHKPAELSGGQQQRVAIARALAGDPGLILADEPTGNLDSHTGDDIMSLLRGINDRGNTIVLITHDAKVAHAANRQIRIVDGRIREEGEA